MLTKISLCALLISTSAFCSQAPAPSNASLVAWQTLYKNQFQAEFEILQKSVLDSSHVANAHRSAQSAHMSCFLAGMNLMVEQQKEQTAAIKKQTDAMERIAASLELLTRAPAQQVNGITPAAQDATAAAKK